MAGAGLSGKWEDIDDVGFLDNIECISVIRGASETVGQVSCRDGVSLYVSSASDRCNLGARGLGHGRVLCRHNWQS